MTQKVLAVMGLMIAISTCIADESGAINLKPENDTLICKQLADGKQLETVFPFPSTIRKSFTASTTVDLGTFNHYGKITAGFKGATNDSKFAMFFCKGDSGNRGVGMELCVTEGSGFGSSLCELPKEVKSFTVVFKFNANLNRYKMIVLWDDGVHAESDWVKIRGYFSVDEFFINVGRQQKGVVEPGSSIKWDAGRGAVHAVSHIGNEGGYKYLIEAWIKDVTLQMD